MLKNIYRFISPKFKTLFSEYSVNFMPRYGHGKPPHPELYNIINTNDKQYSALLNKALEYKEIFFAINKSDNESDANKPTWNNGFLPGLDIIMLYTVLANFKPKKYIEVGSGNSTKVAYKAKKDESLELEIISIDPHPRAEINHLSDKVIRNGFENINYDEILRLQENDILFIDNSHRILPNSDAMVFFLEILPKLNKGVIVHIHDIYLPYDYPQFMCDRFYSEQYGLAINLLANPNRYQTLIPNYYIYENKTLHEILNPIWNHDSLKGVETHGGSFWLKIQ